MKDENKPQLSLYIYEKALTAALKPATKTLYHEVEHAGYGAMISRLMTGLNLAIAGNSNYYFRIESAYQIEQFFEIKPRQNEDDFVKNKIQKWDFHRDTWNVKYKPLSWRWFFRSQNHKKLVRAEHQFPACPIQCTPNISRHQWCSVLAQLICGNPTQQLLTIIEKTKSKIDWTHDAIHIGVHVRRGDKNTECPYIPTETYTQFIDNIAQKFNNKKIEIFLASDDEKCIDDFTESNPNIRILWDADEPRYNNCNVHMVCSQSNLANQESITAAKNIYMLGQCDYVIGMATAQFTWIGGLLCVFKNNFDTSRHIMINALDGQQSHWACSYGFKWEDLKK